MQLPTPNSPSLEQVGRGLDLFIGRSLDEFESRHSTFKKSLLSIRNVFDQPSLRLQLSSLCKTDSLNSAEHLTGGQSDSKMIVQRLCQWLSFAMTNDENRTTTDRPKMETSDMSTAYQIESGRICLSAQLVRLWIFTHRNLNKMKSEGLLSLAPASSSRRGSAVSLRIELQSELSHHPSPQLAGHLEVIARTTAESITVLVTLIRHEVSQLSPIQSSIILSAIVLAELLCHVIFWVISFPQLHDGTSTGIRDPIATLRRAIPQFVLSACDVVELATNINETQKLDALLEDLCGVLTSPLLSQVRCCATTSG